MCRKCLCKVLPDRGSTCLDGGSYFLNFNHCNNCLKKEKIQIKDKTQYEDDDGVETVKYQHICELCGHVVATHEYTFQVDSGYQEYEMNCELCGFGQDRICIMPDDPEKCHGEF